MIARMLQKNPVQKVVTNRSLISPAPSPFVKCLTARRISVTATAVARQENIPLKSVEILREKTERNKE